MSSIDQTIGDVIDATRDALESYAKGRDAEADAIRADLDAVREQLSTAQAAVCPDPAAHVTTPPPDPEPEPPVDPEPDPDPDPPVLPPVEPDPQPVVTLIGACPDGGNNGSVVTKYGTGAASRCFDGGRGFAYVPDRPAAASNVHASFKPSSLAAITDSAIRSACTNLRDGDRVTVWHESDVKYRKDKSLATLQARLAMIEAFHTRVVRMREAGDLPHLVTVHVIAGWSVDESGSVDPLSPNLAGVADELGVDMDGIPAKDGFYDFARLQLGSKFRALYRAGGYSGWCVPEFCMPSTASDPDRTKRIAWFRDQVARLKVGVPAAGIGAPGAIAWFDTSGIIGPTERLTAPNEVAAWAALKPTRT